MNINCPNCSADNVFPPHLEDLTCHQCGQTFRKPVKMVDYAGMWRSGSHLVVAASCASFPPRCLKTNEFDETQRPIKLVSGHGLLFKKIASLKVHLNAKWRGRMNPKIGPMLLLLSVAAFFGFGFYAFDSTGADWAYMAMRISMPMMLLGAIVTFIQNLSPLGLKIHRLSGEIIWIAGVCPEFLNELPEWSDEGFREAVAASQGDRFSEVHIATHPRVLVTFFGMAMGFIGGLSAYRGVSPLEQVGDIFSGKWIGNLQPAGLLMFGLALAAVFGFYVLFRAVKSIA